jgi:predicted transcriptional regulator
MTSTAEKIINILNILSLTNWMPRYKVGAEYERMHEQSIDTSELIRILKDLVKSDFAEEKSEKNRTPEYRLTSDGWRKSQETSTSVLEGVSILV